jgi:hypothetical protein
LITEIKMIKIKIKRSKSKSRRIKRMRMIEICGLDLSLAVR